MTADTGTVVALTVWRHASGALQVEIGTIEPDGSGLGYRLAGPKFDGDSTVVLRTELDQHDAIEIRHYLEALS